VFDAEAEATAFSPAHITGFFQIFDQPKNPLFKGSKGAGVALTKGAKTTVQVKKSGRKSVEIRINGKRTEAAEVSKSVANAFLSLVGAKCQLAIEHEINVPLGCGLGSSGAGALSLALALNKALGLGLSRIEAAQIAHVAEVKHKTGLGTVIGETFGGMEIRVKPGAPGIGEVKSVTVDGNYVVACLPFGPLTTKKALSDPKLRKLINRYGGKLVDKLVTEPQIRKFMELSRSFAESTSLTSKRVRKVFADADSEDFVCSMAIFGETVFSIVGKDEAEDLLKIFRRHKQPQNDVISAQIDFKGARILR
jgi:pantoate kinase